MPLYVDTAELRRLLNKRGMSLRDLSDRTGLSWTFVKYLANGQRNPSFASAEDICEALGVSPDVLFPVTSRPPRRDDFPVDSACTDAPDAADPGAGEDGVAA